MNRAAITVRSYVCWREAVPAVGGEGAEIRGAPFECRSSEITNAKIYNKIWDHSLIRNHHKMQCFIQYWVLCGEYLRSIDGQK
jgi:hypothetical protein